jgi:hypothetical protein
MIRTHSFPVRALAVLVVALGAFAWAASPSGAAPSEPQQGAQIISEVEAGKLKATSLDETQYERVGQYLMGRVLGSEQRYEAMDSVMDRMMGQSVSDQMYLYMGERYLGKSASPNGSYGPYYGWMANMMSRYGGHYAGTMSGYMMGAYRSLAGSGAAPYGGMMGGAYPGMMGYHPTSTASGSGGMATGAIVALAVLGALLLGGLAFFAWPRMRGHGHGGPAAPSAS